MKRIFLLVAVTALSNAFSQEMLHCGSDEMEHKLFQEHPEYQQAFVRSKRKLEAFTKQYQENPTKSGATYIIPVVFHIIHNNGPENINDSQIHDAVKQVNLQYRKLNPDTNQIVTAFQSIAADAGIEIRLAQIDPDGNCTSGITRTVSTLTYPGDHQVKSLIHWPPEKYLNIYVCFDAAGLAGHALMPAAADTIPQWDGIVMRHDYVGTIGTSDYFRRTVLSHEIGHYLNLYHIWGGNNVPDFYYLPVGNAGNCSYDDEVTDTPNTIGWSSCNLNASSCGSGLDNVQNYMDYAYCALMFTEGQKVRMHAALNSSVAQRNNLWNPANLAATGTDDLTNQLCLAKFESSKQLICQGESILFKDVSSHGVTSRQWTIESGTIQGSSSNDTAVVIYNQVGTFDVSLKVSNGIDTLELLLPDYITVMPVQGTDHGITEGFQSDLADFKHKWHVREVGQTYNWEITNTGFQSSQSVKINNYDGGTNQVYEFFSDPLDLSGFTTLAIAFDWAYAQRISGNADLLRIALSNDCGETWITKKTYVGNSLKSVSQLVANPFMPASVNEWTSDTILISGASSFTDHTQVKFRFESKGGNNFYLDNIRIGRLNELGLHELGSETDFEIYPNPAAGFTFLRWQRHVLQKICLIDTRGRIVFETADLKELDSFAIPLEGLDAGYYFVQITGETGAYALPLIVN